MRLEYLLITNLLYFFSFKNNDSYMIRYLKKKIHLNNRYNYKIKNKLKIIITKKKKKHL